MNSDLATVQPSDIELRTAVEKCLAEFHSIRRSITGLCRTPITNSSSFAIENLDLRFEGDAGSKVVFKSLGRSAILDVARPVKPMFLYDPLREIEAYKLILRYRL